MLHIVIPAYNEELRLPRTLRELRRFVREHRAVLQPVEVVVVDNLSTDATAAVALEASTAAVPVRVVTCAVRGKGAAVAAGVAATGATASDVVVFMDADGATHLDALLEAWRLLALGADVAIGSRAAEGSDTAARHSRLREAGALRYRALTAKVVPGIRDTQCGFKALRGDLAVAVFAALRTTGFSFDVELLARLQRGGAVIEEFPVQWADVPGSTFAPLRHGAGSFLNLAVIAWLLRTTPAGRTATVPARVALPAAAALPAVATLPALPAGSAPAAAPALLVAVEA